MDFNVIWKKTTFEKKNSENCLSYNSHKWQIFSHTFSIYDKNVSHTISIYRKMFIIEISCNFLYVWSCMEFYDKKFPIYENCITRIFDQPG